MYKSTLAKKKSKNFYFTVLEQIKLNKYPTQIAKDLKISKQKLNYYIAELKRKGCIKMLSQGAWIYLKDYNKYKVKRVKKINLSNSSQPQHFLKKDEVRGHGFMFRLKIKKIRNWNKRRDFLDKKNIKYKPMKYGERIDVKGRKIHLFNTSIIIYDRESYISDLAKETRSLAIYNFLSLIKRIENIFKVSFEYKKQYHFRIPREHYALIKNCMARQYNKEGKKLDVNNGKGTWLIIDNSFNVNELETIRNREINEYQAVDDNEGVQEYFNSHKHTKFKITPEFVLNGFKDIYENQKLMTNNQSIFDANMKSHLNILDKLGNAVNELRKEIKNGKNKI